MSQTVLVTGAASGIGKATAQRLLGLNHCVIAMDRPGAHWWSPKANTRLIVVEHDLAQTDLIEGLIQIVGGMALLTTMLPNSSKYGFVTKILKFLNMMGANFGKSKNRDD